MTATSFVLRTALLCSVFILAACAPDEPSPPMNIAPEVSVVTLKTEPVVLKRELPGRTRAFAIAEVRPQVTGIVRERLFTEGSQVQAGDPLYQLDDAIYRAAYNSAKANLARADALVEVSRLNAERAEELIKTNAVSRQEYQNLMAARSAAEAEVGVARAQLENAKVRLDYARIVSPIDGVTGRSTVTQGALVTADQASFLTTVQQLDPMYVDITQSASEILQLRRELSKSAFLQAEKIPVTILFADGTPLGRQGEVTFADVTVEPATGSIAAHIVVPNPEHELLPGMYVRAQVSTAIIEDGLLVPQQGITRNPKGEAIAMVVAADDTVERRTVDVSITLDGNWLVRDGLAAGDRVVVEGLQKIMPGRKVTITDRTSP